MIELAVSILSADFARLGAEAQAAAEGGAVIEEGSTRECARRLLESALAAANEAGQEISTMSGADGSDRRGKALSSI